MLCSTAPGQLLKVFVWRESCNGAQYALLMSDWLEARKGTWSVHMNISASTCQASCARRMCACRRPAAAAPGQPRGAEAYSALPSHWVLGF